VADVQYKWPRRKCGSLGRVRDSDRRAKFVNAGIRLDDALERYAESRRPAIVQLPSPGVVDGSRQSAQLEERYAPQRLQGR
jgi:hypothetical protein